MTITERSLKKYINKLLSENVSFFQSPDSDRPGNKQIIMFDDYPYELVGNTHGKKSHAIKHLMEFKPDLVDSYLEFAIASVKDAPNIKLVNLKSGAILASGPAAVPLLTAGAMLNTFDSVNDKVQMGINLAEEEMIILDIIRRMTSDYVQMLESDIEEAVDVDDVIDPNALSSILTNAKVIKFSGMRGDALNHYYLDLTDTGLIAEKDGMIATMFRIDKRGNDMKKVTSYFETAAQVINPILMSTLAAMSTSDEPILERKIRLLIREMINEPRPQVMYTGIVLSPAAVAHLEAKIYEMGFIDQIPDWTTSMISGVHGHQVLNHHMTLTPGELRPADPARALLGEPMTLIVVGWGVDPELGIAAWKVLPPEGVPIKSGNPHITAALSTPAVKPHLAGKIKQWIPLDAPFEVQGVLKEVHSIIM